MISFDYIYVVFSFASDVFLSEKPPPEKKKTDISHQPEIKTRLYLGLQEIHMEGSTCFAFNVNIVSFT